MREDQGLREWAMHEALRDALSAKDDPEEFLRRMEAVPGLSGEGGMGNGAGEQEDFCEALSMLLELRRAGNVTAASYLQDLISQNPSLRDLLKGRIG